MSSATGMRGRVRTLGIAVLKRTPWLRARYRAARHVQRYLVFRWRARGTSDPGLIVFECFAGRSYAGSPRAIYEAMLTDPRFARSRFVWSFRDPRHADDFAALADPRTSIVRYRGGDFYRAFGQARVWINNAVSATELTPRPDQYYIQTWHGTPLKRIGIDVVETTASAMNGKAEIDRRYRLEARKIRHFLSACEFTTRCFASAFGVSADAAKAMFVETGNARNDALVTATPDDRTAARERLGIGPDRKVVLYAPTWRDDQHSSRSGYVYHQPLDLAALRKSLGEDYLILFRAHYLVTNSIDLAAHQGFVRDVSGIDEINELCLAADVLVTDYSSIYFDFALLDRPMVFFLYDLDRYVTALRGLYLPIAELPGPIVTTQDELVVALQRRDLAAAGSTARAALNTRMTPHDDGMVCGRVLDLVHTAVATGLRTH